MPPATHPDRQALLRAVIANPDSDLERLIFADWLEEHGDAARAEFIRVQCEYARLVALPGSCGGPCAYDPDISSAQCSCRRCALRRRDWELYGQVDTGLGRRLLNELPPPVNEQGWAGALRHCFHRGFIETITCTWSNWCRHATAIKAVTPLRKVKLTTWPPAHAALDAGIEFQLPGLREFPARR
jgi:uncharacterized protein (TIGR02996 family)